MHRPWLGLLSTSSRKVSFTVNPRSGSLFELDAAANTYVA
tara:strand:- start:452 stop:571 length:120 start_codon:yes stop_codon:yes gene_type:complete